MRILFQGDSITDGGRDTQNLHSLGCSYPSFAAKLIQRNHPDCEFEFINRGVSGNQTVHLLERTERDIIALEPDIVSILIGINDVWYFANRNLNFLPHEVFEKQYRDILITIKQKTKAKIVILEPYLLPAPDKLFFRKDFDPKRKIVKRLAEKFADVYIPTDSYFSSACEQKDYTFFSGDGVHPNSNGAQFIGEIYAEAVRNIITELSK